MPREAPDLFFAQLVLDYLQHADSITAGVPDEDTLPKTILDAGMVQQVPALIVTAEEGQGSVSRRTINLVCSLLFHNRATGDDAADDAKSLEYSTARDTAAQYLDVVESRLMDRAAFGAFIAALDESRRDGFVILKWRRLPQPHLERRKDQPRRLTLMCAFEIQVLWARQAA